MSEQVIVKNYIHSLNREQNYECNELRNKIKVKRKVYLNTLLLREGLCGKLTLKGRSC